MADRFLFYIMWRSYHWEWGIKRPLTRVIYRIYYKILGIDHKYKTLRFFLIDEISTNF